MTGGTGGEGSAYALDALATVIGLVFAVGCGSKARSEEPVKLVDQPRTIRLGLIGAPLVVDGDALVHVAYRRDRFRVVRRDLASGAARTLMRGSAEPWSVDEIAARSGLVAIETSAPLGHAVAHRVLALSPSGRRPRVLGRARDNATCGGTVSVHNMTPARAVLVSEVRASCARRSRASLVLRLHGAAGSRTVMRRRISPDRAARLITEPVLYTGVGGGRTFFADPGDIQLAEQTGERRVIERPAGGQFVGAEINDHGDLLFHQVSNGRLRTSLLPRGEGEPVELIESTLDRPATVRLCGDLIARYARRGNGEAELSVAPVTDATRFRALRAWPARLADAQLVCDQRRAVLIRQRRASGPSSAEVIRLATQGGVGAQRGTPVARAITCRTRGRGAVGAGRSAAWRRSRRRSGSSAGRR